MITTTRSSQVTWNQGGQERDGKLVMALFFCSGTVSQLANNTELA